MTCADRYAEAQRGFAWLELLKHPRPEPRPELLGRILAATAGEPGVSPFEALPVPTTPGLPLGMPAHFPGQVLSGQMLSGQVLPFRPRPAFLPTLGRILAEPRLAMTAAMAFFSVALTLNLTGVRLDQIHAADLNPANIRRTVRGAQAGATRYYDNLRVVHVMESRVAYMQDLRENLQPDTQPEPAAPAPAPVRPSEAPSETPQPRKPETANPNGTSHIQTLPLRRGFALTSSVTGMQRSLNRGLYIKSAVGKHGEGDLV